MNTSKTRKTIAINFKMSEWILFFKILFLTHTYLNFGAQVTARGNMEKINIHYAAEKTHFTRKSAIFF